MSDVPREVLDEFAESLDQDITVWTDAMKEHMASLEDEDLEKGGPGSGPHPGTGTKLIAWIHHPGIGVHSKGISAKGKVPAQFPTHTQVLDQARKATGSSVKYDALNRGYANTSGNFARIATHAAPSDSSWTHGERMTLDHAAVEAHLKDNYGIKSVYWDADKADQMEMVAKAGNGVMLAFWPAPELAEKIAVEGGEAPDELHVTLAYFGGLDDVPLDALPALEDAVERFALSHAPLKVTLGGLGRFPATPHSDGLDVAYLGIHSDGIQEFRQELVDAVEAVGLEPRKNFGYTPHMTLKLMDPDEYVEPDVLKPVDATFDKIVLSIGTASKEYELKGSLVVKDDAFEMSGDIIKVDQVKHLVFGIFSLVSIGGKAVVDTQGDTITPDVLEEAVYDYVLHARTGAAMHKVEAVGQLVESMVFTPEKQKALLTALKAQGIEAECDVKSVLWWGGFFIHDGAVWDKIVSGELKAFSIGGRGKREKLED
jgi:2'-5' RNA ligase